MKTLLLFIVLIALASSFPTLFFLILAGIFLAILMLFVTAYLTSKAEDKAIAKEREKQSMINTQKAQQEREKAAQLHAYTTNALRLEREREQKHQQEKEEKLLQFQKDIRKYEKLARDAALKGDSDTARCWRYAAQDERQKLLEYKWRNNIY